MLHPHPPAQVVTGGAPAAPPGQGILSAVQGTRLVSAARVTPLATGAVRMPVGTGGHLPALSSRHSGAAVSLVAVVGMSGPALGVEAAAGRWWMSSRDHDVRLVVRRVVRQTAGCWYGQARLLVELAWSSTLRSGYRLPRLVLPCLACA